MADISFKVKIQNEKNLIKLKQTQTQPKSLKK